MWFYRHLLEAEDSDNVTTNADDFDFDTGFPPDLFSNFELKSGAVILYIIGIAKSRNFLIHYVYCYLH